MLTKFQKNKLKEVCKVLFPKYKHVSFDTISNKAYFKANRIPIIGKLMAHWVVSLTELLEYQIPRQLAIFKWDNPDFISVVQEDLIRCDLQKEDRILYFFEEIAKVKYADIYKQLNVAPSVIKTVIVPDEEDSMFEEMIRMHQERNRMQYGTALGRILRIKVNHEILFYISLFILLAYVLLSNMKI